MKKICNLILINHMILIKIIILKKINQTSNFSDIALEAKTNFDNIFFKIDSRLSNIELEKKEMNYFFKLYNDLLI